MYGADSYGLATLLKHEELTTTAAEMYESDGPVVEFTRLSVTNYTTTDDVVVTLYHLPDGVSAVADEYIVFVTKLAGQSTELSPMQGRNTGITINDGESLWAKASAADSVVLVVYGIPRNTAPVVR